MHSRHFRSVLRILLPLLVGAGQVRAEFRILNWNSDGPDQSEVRVTSCLERTPHRGFLPVKVTIRNGLNRDRLWTLSFSGGYERVSSGDSNVQSSFRLPAASGSTVTHELLVPLPTQLARNRSTTLDATLSDGRRSEQGYLQSHQHNSWLTLAMSQSLSGSDNLKNLSDRIKTKQPKVRSSDPVAILLDVSTLPARWEALSGIDALILSGSDWNQITPVVQQALRDWVRLGHELIFLLPSGSVDSKVGFGPSGLGKLHYLEGSADTFPAQDLQRLLNSPHQNLLHLLREDYDTDWTLQDQFGSKDFKPGFILLLLFAFAILIGPVNLFRWADIHHRHRLFFTVPAISATTSLLLLITILFQDGFGGDGRRAGFLQIFADSADRRACLIQEQISRTGVLTRRAFPESEGTFLSHVLLKHSRWTFVDTRYDFRSRFSLFGDRWHGDWFRSRSEQAHFAQSSVPTRSRIERLPTSEGQPPRLVSSLEFGLRSLVYLDQEGQPWQSLTPLAPGDTAQLTRLSPQEFNDFWTAETAQFSASQQRKLKGTPRRNICFAIVSDPGAHLIPTAKSIRWQGDSLLLMTEPVSRTPSSS